jgi:hypothetical protein
MRITTLITTHQQAKQPVTLIRRMSRILLKMIDGGALTRDFDGDLITDGGRWFVGPTAMNPAAAKQLVDLGLVTPSSVGGFRYYQLSENLRRRIHNFQTTATGDDGGFALESFCCAQIQEALNRKTARAGRVGLQ